MTGICTNPKSGELLAPYEFGLLSDEERAGFEAHLAGCARCADDLFDLAHVTTAAHVEAAGIARALHESAGARAVPRPPRPRPRRPRRLRRWAAPLAGLAAAAVLVVMLTGGGPDYTSLARLTPADYVPIDTRGETDSPGALFADAMSLYADERYAAAVPLLESALARAESEPGWRYAEQARFYLGVSRLLAGDASGAETMLQSLLDAGSLPLRDRARWYLAQAALARNDRASAETRLRALADSSPVYARDAAALLAEIEALE